MVGLDRPEVGELGNRRGSVAQGRRINVVEARAGIPERLPLGMRPVVGQKACVANKRAFDGGPFVGVLGFEVGADQHRREEEYEEEIQQDLLRARELGKRGHFSSPAAFGGAAMRTEPRSNVHYGTAGMMRISAPIGFFDQLRDTGTG